MEDQTTDVLESNLESDNEFFNVLRVHREDLVDLYPDAENLGDAEMETIADKMSDLLMNRWSDAIEYALEECGYLNEDLDEE